MNTCGRDFEEKEESIVFLLTFKALKWNVFTVTAYKDMKFMRWFSQSATDHYQSVPIYLSIVIENQYQSILPQASLPSMGHQLSESID